MLQFSQYFDLKYIEVVSILFSLVSLFLFVVLIIKVIKNRNSDEIKTENTDVINTGLSSKNTYSLNLKNIRGYVVSKILPCLFIAIFLLYAINSFFPAILNSIFPPDSYQTITITNNKKTSQDLILLGRISYSNDWIPIIPFNDDFQLVPLMNFAPSEKKSCNIRTGTKDIDYIIVANVSHNKINNETDAITMSVPRNNIAVYTESMNKLSNKPNIYFWGTINYFLLYITAIFGSVALLLFIFFGTKDKTLPEKTLLSLLPLLLILLFGYITFLNMRTMLLLI